MRDCYDSATGRYCQSDPLGVRGLATVQGHVPGFLDFAASWSSTRPTPGVTAEPFVPGVPEVAMEHPSIALVRPLASSLNLYAYAENNPLSFIDPEGLQSQDPINLMLEARANANLLPILSRGSVAAMNVANRTGDPSAFAAWRYFDARILQCGPSFVQSGALVSNTGNVPGFWGALRQTGRNIWSR